MSNYNKVIKNDDGITTDQLLELLSKTVKGDNIYINVPNPNGGYPIAIKLKSAYSFSGCLYIDVPELKQNKDE